jgi:hypothetical protein
MGIPEEYFWVWEKGTVLTSIGSMIPSSRMKEVDAQEEEGLSQSVLIGERGGPSKPLAECESSLVHVLADQSLGALRLYALEPAGHPIDRTPLSNAVERHMTI